MTDRDKMERRLALDLEDVTVLSTSHSRAKALIARGWQRIKGEGGRPCRADNTACSEQSGNAPSPTLRQSVAELREIAKDGDFPTLEELDEIRHGPSPEDDIAEELEALRPAENVVEIMLKNRLWEANRVLTTKENKSDDQWWIGYVQSCKDALDTFQNIDAEPK